MKSWGQGVGRRTMPGEKTGKKLTNYLCDETMNNLVSLDFYSFFQTNNTF